jgi:hypothetical protein
MARELSGMSESQESISERSSFRKGSRSELDAMSSVALDAQRMARDAAHPLEPGDTIKAQMNRAAANLRYPLGDWRVKAAWYGEAGSWGAAMFRDFEERFHAWRRRQEEKANVRRSDAATALAELREVYARVDAAGYREQIEGIERALIELGITPSPLSGTARSSEHQG